MKKARIFIALAFIVAIGSAFASKAKPTAQYNYKDDDQVCTFYSNTEPCGGGTLACTVTIGSTSRQIYVAESLSCVTQDNTKQ